MKGKSHGARSITDGLFATDVFRERIVIVISLVRHPLVTPQASMGSPSPMITHMALVNYVIHKTTPKVINLGKRPGCGRGGKMTGIRKMAKEGMDSIIRMHYEHV